MRCSGRCSTLPALLLCHVALLRFAALAAPRCRAAIVRAVPLAEKAVAAPEEPACALLATDRPNPDRHACKAERGTGRSSADVRRPPRRTHACERHQGAWSLRSGPQPLDLLSQSYGQTALSAIFCPQPLLLLHFRAHDSELALGIDSVASESRRAPFGRAATRALRAPGGDERSKAAPTPTPR